VSGNRSFWRLIGSRTEEERITCRITYTFQYKRIRLRQLFLSPNFGKPLINANPRFAMGSNASSGPVNEALHGSRDTRYSETEDIAEKPNPTQETNRKSQLFPVSKIPHTNAAHNIVNSIQSINPSAADC